MKKLSILLIALLLLVCLLASCGGGDTPPTTETGGEQTGGNGNEGGGGNTDDCNHQYGDWIVKHEPKCITRGENYRICDLCGDKETQYTMATGHTEEIVPAVAPTCSSYGFTEGKKCSVCDAVIKAQTRLPMSDDHDYSEIKKIMQVPTFSQGGRATFMCSKCLESTDLSLPQLKNEKLTKDDIYNVEASSIYNPAVDNVWKMFDGKTDSAGVYAQGSDWFGDLGDVLIVTLDQEIVLKELYVYVAGNWTTATVRVKNANGQVLISESVRANASAYGGPGDKIQVFKGEKYRVYTIEVEITSLKESYQTFKLTEIEAWGAKEDTRILKMDDKHICDHREFVEQMTPSTCVARGTARYACYCGKTGDYYTPKLVREFTELVSYTAPTCTSPGQAIYNCKCGTYKRTIDLDPLDHEYQRVVEYTKMPTHSEGGNVTLKCVRCDLTQSVDLSPLPLEAVQYLRVVEVKGGTVKLKFNLYGDSASYEVRYSENEITKDNYNQATAINATISGNKEYTVTFNLDAGLDKCYYVAVRPYAGTNYGEISTVRVGGDKLIPIDYSQATVYHGEILNSFEKLFDEQDEGFRTGSTMPSSAMSRIFTNTSDTFYNLRLAPIVDLETLHYVSSAYLYYTEAGASITVRWSDTPVDFMAEDSAWDGYYTFTATSGWNKISINEDSRYIQVVFTDGTAPCEAMIYGYQNGDGDPVSTEKKDLPTINEMMGMCGFTAIGGGNTPIDSVICTSVLREYRTFGWSYDIESYPEKTSYFSNSWMGNFDNEYRNYSQAGILLVPCIQWDLANTALSNKIDENGLPLRDDEGKLVKGDYWTRFDPMTYFIYADGMFGFAARYGTNNSPAIREIANAHSKDAVQEVGLGYIKWLELGNEPDATWHGGIVNYYSAYQLAALTSAGYDGHCRTLVSEHSAGGYHFGAKNADSQMGVAMAGISATSNEYITAMCYWMKANRADGKVAVDAFNVHQYMSKPITVQGDKTRYVGMSPEEADLPGILSQLVSIRNKYYPEKEVWLTEFGWDTNQSYATVNSAHAYGNYTGRQVQAMWLTRAYLLLSATGVDKATMYMCEDTGVEAESVGKFGTSGVIGYEYDENGKVVEVKKDSYYYLYTLKNTLGGYSFSQEIDTYNENVMVYEYVNEAGKTAYAVWCPTSDGTTVENYCLRVGEGNATLVEAIFGNINGHETDLEVDEYGYVTVNVSENPVYIVID